LEEVEEEEEEEEEVGFFGDREAYISPIRDLISIINRRSLVVLTLSCS
jgi:hypothetical protein